jgi:hypothetical protein
VTLLTDLVRARDGRCSACRLLFANLRGVSRLDTPAQAHAEHTWTHYAPASTERTE